ncbi:inositol monophosphatase family protein [Marinomonas fungiae]|uniref:Archaeal fructose-1,6-bisphosphatase or related enzyme of inositol monophosphatase family n=1 Tax=Marinomonas fungiae TaxID=1137284 RepID=A0A0K6IJ46_9GAMM|nr:inositol monophosphatase [Marinomonas fungiae]CUB03372.1 Archaeal fructose-1,6-bisphosphatase or related enzyme of inositol monophosphatase family [Marinomonas fungiae]
MLSPEQKLVIIETVREVSKQEILPRFRALSEDLIDTKSGFDDLVTIADVAAEKAMTERFRKQIPAALIVGEEAVAANQAVLDSLDSESLVIIIDPIDGTWNYANGVSNFGVLIAAAYQGETVFGLLYDVINDDWIEASKGEGAWYVKLGKTPRRLKLSQAPADQKLVGIYSPFLFKDMAQRQQAAMTQVNYARVISMRCSCHEYRTMLGNSIDFFISPKPNSWDHAAGILAFQEAGGVVAMQDGSEYRPSIRTGMIIAARNLDVLRQIQQDFSWYQPL